MASNIQDALDILEIHMDNIKFNDLTQEYIRKSYHKMALKWHPDKNDNSPLSTNKFQKINEAYYFLSNELKQMNEDPADPFVSSFGSKESKMYSNILSTFISSIFKGTYNEIFVDIIKDIVIGYKDRLSLTYLRKLFDELDKQKSIDIYNIIYRYKDILYINNETLDFVSLIIKEKYKNDSVYILNPSLRDLLDNNIYKLYIDNQLYLVPLWHNELYFDAPDGTEIIVLCQPVLPEFIRIDEHNNIYITKKIDVHNELPNIILNNEFVSINVGEKCFFIPVSNLTIKREQIYRLRNQGISNIVEKDIYNVSVKSDIIVTILLV
jgi:DnaJ-class molecular chaperone